MVNDLSKSRVISLQELEEAQKRTSKGCSLCRGEWEWIPSDVMRFLGIGGNNPLAQDVYRYAIRRSLENLPDRFIRSARALEVLFYSGNPDPMAVITSDMVEKAKSEMSHNGALPRDWPDWFPQAVQMKLGLNGSSLRASDVYRYAILRTLDDDVTRYLESAQCLALLHFLGNPSNSDIIQTTKL
jgi:hypothetical protein